MIHRIPRVVIADEHRLLSDALLQRIEQETDMNVVGTAADSDTALALVHNIRPNALAIDVNIPGRGCLDAIARISAAVPEARILLIAGTVSNILLDHALRFDLVRGCVDKREPLDKFIDALRKVSNNEFFFSETLQSRLRFDSAERRYRLSGEVSCSELTTRQLEILRHLATGKSVNEIARTMHSSEKSVDSHKYRIMNRLRIRDRVALARFAIREGLVSL